MMSRVLLTIAMVIYIPFGVIYVRNTIKLTPDFKGDQKSIFHVSIFQLRRQSVTPKFILNIP